MMSDCSPNSFLYTTPEMSRIFSAREQLRAMTRFEWSLTQALERRGLAEPGSGDTVEALLGAEFADLEALEREARDAGNIAIPFVRQLTCKVEASSEPASRAVHLGATSQDLLDSALVLQMREGFRSLEQDVARLDAALVRRVREHRGTLLLGRTWLQPGPPVTLGLKLAGTLSALRRDRERLSAAAAATLVLQFGGAVGTLAALGACGPEVSAAMAQLLDLREPDLPWHTQRDRLVEVVACLAVLTGTLAKFARDISLLMQAETGEVSEGGEARGGSSAMPHKHNPVACAALIAVHTRMPGLVSTMLHAMPQEHERGLGLWQAEWDTVPKAFELTAAGLSYAIEIAEGLAVDAARMQLNVERMLGLPMSEAVSASLAPKIGRSAAHAILREATRRAFKEKRHLGDILKKLPEVKLHLADADIDRLLDPRAYLGSADAMIARVLGENHAGC